MVRDATTMSRLRKAGGGRDRGGRASRRGIRADDRTATTTANSTATTTAALSALVDAGLKPGVLTLQGEKRKYSGDRARYLKARDYVVAEWAKDRTRFLGRQACVDGYVRNVMNERGEELERGGEEARFVEEVYGYLHARGCINVGILKNDPLVCVPARVFSTGAGAGGEEGNGGDGHEGGDDDIADEAIEGALYVVLERVNMDEASEKAIRQQLAEHFGSSMEGKRRKKLIKRLVAGYIQGGGVPTSWKESHLKSKASRYGKVVVVGAGPAGLLAGLHLKRHGCDVTVLEARDRVGGRVFSYTGGEGREGTEGRDGGGMGAPCDLGASIITGRACDAEKGYRADPSALLCEQLGIKLHDVNFGNLPIYQGRRTGRNDDDSGPYPKVVDTELDDMVGHVMDELLDRQAAYCEKLSLEEQNKQNLGALVDQARARWEEETAEKVRRKMASKERLSVKIGLRVVAPHDSSSMTTARVEVSLSLDVEMGDGSYSSDDDDFPPEELPKTLDAEYDRLLGWHWAHLEYGNSAPIRLLSAPHWNDDEDMGGFGGPHSFVVGGYDQPFKQIAELLDVRMGARVSEIEVDSDRPKNGVKVVTEDDELVCDAVLVTVPLGVLKRQAISFSPELPQWKKDAIDRMGFGKLDKVFLEFENVFWDNSVDYFGVDKDNTEATRGLCFMFWNLHRFCGKPILVALISGEAAHANEETPVETLRDAAVDTLRSVFKDVAVPAPVAYHVTKWGQEVDTCGSYSFTAVGASLNDYEMLARPVGRRIFFAGEHTCQEHPDTVGGAMLTGLREASRILELDDADAEADGEPLVVANMASERKVAKEKPGKKRKEDGTGDRNGGLSKANGKAKANGVGDDDLTSHLPKEFASQVTRDRMDEQARAVHRAVAKGMWKALMAAEYGDTSPILNSLRDADEARREVGGAGITGVVGPLVETAPATLVHVFKDDSCLQILVDWVEEMNDDPSRTKDLLLLLKAFALPDWSAIGHSKGRARLHLLAIKSGQHPDNAVKIAAKRIVQWMNKLDIMSDDDWLSPSPAKRKPATNDARKAKPKPKKAKTTPASVKKTPTAAKIATTTRFDDETQRKLDEAEAEIKAMQAEAERLKSQAATHAKASDAGNLDSPTFENFEAYRKSLNKKKSKSNMARVGNGNGNGSGPANEAGLAFRKNLDSAIHGFLKPHLESRRVNKGTFKEICKKAGEKVWAKTTAADVTKGWPSFWVTRKAMIRKLVEGYVSAYANRG